MITKKELMDALEKVPDDVELEKNSVGNLVGLNDEGKIIGYLDLMDATWHLWKDEMELDDENN